MNEAWQKALTLIKPRIRSVEFRNWVKPVQPLEWRDGVLRVQVKDRDFQHWFSERYEKLVLEALEKVLEMPVTLEYRLANPELFDYAAVPPSPHDDLMPDLTFDNYVVGPSNNMAYVAGMAVAERPGRSYNPLFIYGGTGLGKTHLLHAIGHAAKRLNPGLRVLYITSETYINDLMSAIRQKAWDTFRGKYRDSVDLLLVDDVQFFAGKERTQIEFFHTFNALHAARKQVVFTSDRFPQEIQDIEERLRSRFEGGLIADIKAPEYETRLAILKRKAEMSGFELPDEVADFIAQEVSSHVRELESCLNRLRLEALTRQAGITVRLAQESLKSYFKHQARRISPDAIQKAVAQCYSLDVEELASKSRKKTVATPRHLAMYLCRKLIMISYPEIGQRFGGRDHSSVMSGIRKIEQQIKIDSRLRQTVDDLEKRIKR